MQLRFGRGYLRVLSPAGRGTQQPRDRPRPRRIAQRPCPVAPRCTGSRRCLEDTHDHAPALPSALSKSRGVQYRTRQCGASAAAGIEAVHSIAGSDGESLACSGSPWAAMSCTSSSEMPSGKRICAPQGSVAYRQPQKGKAGLGGEKREGPPGHARENGSLRGGPHILTF